MHDSTAAAGIKIVASLVIAIGATNFSSAIANLKDSFSRIVVLISHANEGGRFLRATFAEGCEGFLFFGALAWGCLFPVWQSVWLAVG